MLGEKDSFSFILVSAGKMTWERESRQVQCALGRYLCQTTVTKAWVLHVAFSDGSNVVLKWVFVLVSTLVL